MLWSSSFCLFVCTRGNCSWPIQPSKNKKPLTKMAKSQRMRVANEKASKNVTLRGNVPKSTVCFALNRLNRPIFWPLFLLPESWGWEVSSRPLATGLVHFCCLWIGTVANHSEHPNGLSEVECLSVRWIYYIIPFQIWLYPWTIVRSKFLLWTNESMYIDDYTMSQ